MRIRNDVIYTTWNESMRTNVEHRATLIRPRHLTRRGAERLLNAGRDKAEPRAMVERVESIQYA